jgi:transcriptional regulator
MFVPDQYLPPSNSWTADLIRRNPLALLTTNGPRSGPPYATHLPVIPDPRMPEDWPERLPEVTLLGHMNRMNPHWAELETGTPVLVVFAGPHAYVSPTVYDVTPAAPTWNFTAVHARGVVSRIDSGEPTLEVVRSTVRALEGEFGAAWDMSGSLDYFRRILPGVGAFRLEVSTVESMFKLSQEQSPELRERVRQSFAQRDSGRHREVAHLMAEIDMTSAL